MLLRLGAWFAAFLALGIWGAWRWEIDVSTNAIAIGAFLLALLAAAPTPGGGRRNQTHR